MKTISIPGFIQGKIAEDWQCGMANVIGAMHYDFRLFEKCDGAKVICPHLLTFQVPDDFDPRAEAVSQLDAQEKEVLARTEAALNMIRGKRNKLLAITNEAA